jgi:hypothetical protein
VSRLARANFLSANADCHRARIAMVMSSRRRMKKMWHVHLSVMLPSHRALR